jgi:FkbM family methyltransferase
MLDVEKADSGLVFDIGMHNGADTAFYLAKGFRVVAVDANPAMVDRALLLFRDEIQNGRLVIIDKAISDHPGSVELNIPVGHDDWASTERTSWGSHIAVQTVKVETVRFEQILSAYGVPYYMKVDIEGAEAFVISAMEMIQIKPRFVSFEASGAHILPSLFHLGYRRFKIIDQARHAMIKLPNPPLEGSFVDQRFTDAHSGPFGEETTGPWVDYESVREEYDAMVRDGRLTWHDFHAALPVSE